MGEGVPWYSCILHLPPQKTFLPKIPVYRDHYINGTQIREVKQCKSMIMLRDLSLILHFLGFCHRTCVSLRRCFTDSTIVNHHYSPPIWSLFFPTAEEANLSHGSEKSTLNEMLILEGPIFHVHCRFLVTTRWLVGWLIWDSTRGAVSVSGILGIQTTGPQTTN